MHLPLYSRKITGVASPPGIRLVGDSRISLSPNGAKMHSRCNGASVFPPEKRLLIRSCAVRKSNIPIEVVNKHKKNFTMSKLNYYQELREKRMLTQCNKKRYFYLSCLFKMILEIRHDK